MSVFGSVFRIILTKLRERAEDKRRSVVILGEELDNLADLMSEVLEATSPGGDIRNDRLYELYSMQQRVWRRWITILGTDGYATKNRALQREIERCVKIAHAAPGAYVDEVYRVQICISEGRVDAELRLRFSESISRLRDLATRLRLES